MKQLFIALACLIALSSCQPNNNGGGGVVNNPSNVVVTSQATNLGDNLNLQALGELVKNCKSAQEIEQKLNASGSINNLDLDGDGNVDYIKVTEYGSGANRGFSFTTEMANGEKQEIATIEIQKGASNVAMNIQGNTSLYGQQNYYQSQFTLSDLMIMNYLFAYHSPYYSPYRYGYYPSYYHSYRSIPVTSYRSNVSTTIKTTKIVRTTSKPATSIKSPNASLTSKTVNTRAQSMAAPKQSQKSFSKTPTTNSKPVTSGFGSKSSSSSVSKPKSSSSSSSGFGSSSRSSSSSSSRRSDYRFKSNVNPLSGSLSKVCSLQGVTYDWKVASYPNEHFTNKKQIGFIAQDLEVVYPQVVNTRTDGYKTVDYDLLVPALVEAIKELNTKVTSQDSIIKSLTAKAQ